MSTHAQLTVSRCRNHWPGEVDIFNDFCRRYIVYMGGWRQSIGVHIYLAAAFIQHMASAADRSYAFGGWRHASGVRICLVVALTLR